MGMKEDLMALARTLEHENDAAADLWSWLPSAKAARACHGDYAFEHRPANADVMREAAAYLAFLNGYDKEEDRKAGWFECPCGECAGPGCCGDCESFADKLMRCRAVEGAPHCDLGKPHAQCPFIRGNGGLVPKP